MKRCLLRLKTGHQRSRIAYLVRTVWRFTLKGRKKTPSGTMRTVVRRKELSAALVKGFIYLTFIGSCWLIITYKISLSLFGCSLLYTEFLQHPCKLCGDHRELYLPVPSWFLWATLWGRSANTITVSLSQQVTAFCQRLHFFIFFFSAIACKPLLDPEHGSHYCFDSYGSNRFNSSCLFHCELGFQLIGAPHLLCQASGKWNHPVPLCQGMATGYK